MAGPKAPAVVLTKVRVVVALGRQERVRLRRPDHGGEIRAGRVVAVEAHRPARGADFERLDRWRSCRVPGQKERDGVGVADRRVERLAERARICAAHVDAHHRPARASRCRPSRRYLHRRSSRRCCCPAHRAAGNRFHCPTYVPVSKLPLVGPVKARVPPANAMEATTPKATPRPARLFTRDPPCRWQWCRTSAEILPRMLVPETAAARRGFPSFPTYGGKWRNQPAQWSRADRVMRPGHTGRGVGPHSRPACHHWTSVTDLLTSDREEFSTCLTSSS